MLSEQSCHLAFSCSDSRLSTAKLLLRPFHFGLLRCSRLLQRSHFLERLGQLYPRLGFQRRAFGRPPSLSFLETRPPLGLLLVQLLPRACYVISPAFGHHLELLFRTLQRRVLRLQLPPCLRSIRPRAQLAYQLLQVLHHLLLRCERRLCFLALLALPASLLLGLLHARLPLLRLCLGVLLQLSHLPPQLHHRRRVLLELPPKHQLRVLALLHALLPYCHARFCFASGGVQGGANLFQRACHRRSELLLLLPQPSRE
mmetsp:Transcript_20509/g.65704  ORF Transcript_20509/g.65704 Transcript_20509/m.65704 type:complete len:257 (+) Transcript_20509:71-841(+)